MINKVFKNYHYLALLLTGLISMAFSVMGSASELATIKIKQSNDEAVYVAEGVVEAIKSSAIAAQVSGSIIALPVKVGDVVKSGQLLARIDTRIANQQAVTNQAQVAAAQAQLSAARKEYERKSRLYAKEYISKAAMERAESEFKTAEAQTKAQQAQSGLANIETGLRTINAPYAGVVAEVLSEVGAMAMPGQPLLVIYDPVGLRVSVNVPQSQLSNLKNVSSVKTLISSASDTERELMSTQLMVLPTTDAVSNMSTVRLNLPLNIKSVKPGMFARSLLPLTGAIDQLKITIPSTAVIKRSELVAVYIVTQQGKPQLRQIRLGRKQGESVEVLAGLKVGELVALDPIAAANAK